jgi:hypothetical protein
MAEDPHLIPKVPPNLIPNPTPNLTPEDAQELLDEFVDITTTHVINGGSQRGKPSATIVPSGRSVLNTEASVKWDALVQQYGYDPEQCCATFRTGRSPAGSPAILRWTVWTAACPCGARQPRPCSIWAACSQSAPNSASPASGSALFGSSRTSRAVPA